jgi:Concanavalin A-like lectin/glucanases superfamily
VRSFPLTVLNGGINRLRVKGGASASQLYDLQNAYITNAGSIVPREGTIRAVTLDSSTVGLAAANGVFNIFSSAFSTATLPANYVLNVLSNPTNPGTPPVKIWFAKPFMGFEFVVAQFADGTIHHYWLQNNGTWTATTDYTSASIVLPPTPNGLAYQGVRDFPSQPLWAPDVVIASASYVEPNSPTGFAYQAIAVTGSPVHTGFVEPVWPTTAGAIIQEFGDFDVSTTQNTGTSPFSTASPLGLTITDRYGDSATVANSGVFSTATSTLSSLTLASTKVTTWKSGTNYAPGAVVTPTTNQGAFINAIPNGDFEGGSGAGGWTFADSGGTAQWNYSATLPYQGAEGISVAAAGNIGASGATATMTSYSLVTPGQSVTASAYVNPNNNGANLTIWIQLNWYNAADTLLSSSGQFQNEQEGFGYRKTSVTGVAPAGAAHVRVAIGAGSGTTSRNAGFADLVTWNLESPSAVTNFLYEAVQPVAGVSAATEPSWPTTLGGTVIDNQVTWKAIGTSIITWQAIPLMQSGLTAPTFPTTIGNTVMDYSTYSNQNGYITTLVSMSWQAVDRHVSDINDPNTTAVALGASHIFAGSNDIVDYSAAVNPIDWTSTNNAGYLPTGLNNYGDNPVTALALYRGNLIVFNAGGYQMWQIDPDPQNMALLDAQPVGSIYARAAQSVANDLLFLTEVGVRNLGTIGATANMAIGNTGQQVDPLVKAQLVALANGTAVYASSNLDPFFSNVGLLLHCDGVQGSTVFTDSSLNNFTVTPTLVTIDTTNPKFGSGAAKQAAAGIGTLTVPNPSLGPLDLSSGAWTVEFWFWATNPSSNGNAQALLFETSDGTITLTYNDLGHFSGVAWGQAIGTTVNTLVANSYNAVAVVCTGSTVTVYANGVAGSPTTVTQAPITAGTLMFGGSSGANFYRGYFDEIRVTKGVARYIANYTPAITAFSTVLPYDPFSLYYPGRGQYWLFFGAQAFVLTINGLNGTKSWARYLFPQVITDWTLNGGILYLRTVNNLVWQLDASTIGVDDANTITTAATPVPFNGVVQWPYLDLSSLGVQKMLVGLDIVGEGNCSMQVAFNQNDKSTFVDSATFTTSTGVTTPYFVQIDDTVPGEPLALPINAASYSPILTFTGSTTSANAWTWQAMNIYFAPAPSGAAGEFG